MKKTSPKPDVVPQGISSDIQGELNTAVAYHQNNELDRAAAIYDRILAVQPDHSDALHLNGLIAHQIGEAERAIGLIRRAIQIKPDSTVYQFNLGVAFSALNRSGDAIAAYRQVLALDPNYPQAHYNLGNIYKEIEQPEEAMACYQKAIAVKPDYLKAYLNIGNIYQEKGQPDDAVAYYRKALEIKPDYADAYFKIAYALKEQNRPGEAVPYYRKALEVSPDFAKAHNNLGNLFQDQGDLEDALVHYQKAVASEPDYFYAYYNMGNLFQLQGRTDEAIASYRKALALDPEYPDLHVNMGLALRRQKRPEEAVACYKRAIALDPDFHKAYSSLVHQSQYLCDWPEVARLTPKLDELTQKSLGDGTEMAETPFEHISRCAEPARNFAVAKAVAAHIQRSVAGLKADFGFDHLKVPGKKITIGYLSNDFCNHPVAHLILSLFGLHDRQAFNVFCYSYGQDDGSSYRRRIAQDCDRFADIRGLNHAAAARRIHEDGVDILVDLMGHTMNNRLEICALRPAPVQVTFLGYPGTTGADFLDYMITDRIVSPPAHAPYYSEKLAYMPHCYQVNDRNQPVSEKVWRRSDAGLPEDGVVFCSFNQTYKIEPVLFDIWMKILRQVPGSVLWLLEGSDAASENLRREAAGRGVEPERLIFAPKIAKEEHLARQRLADLALDTRIVNGHTTTSDALWAGIPVITLQGTHFASRVASGLLNAVGLPELVTRSPEEYEHLAVRLAFDPAELRGLKEKLDRNRLTRPLFDTARYARGLEAIYRGMWNIFMAGQEPRQIAVSETGTETAVQERKAPAAPSFAAEIREAFKQHQAGQTEAAEAMYRKILAANPDHVDALHLCGLILNDRGERDQAIEMIRRAIALYPDNPGFYRNLATIYQSQGNPEAVVECCQKAVGLKPDFAEAYNTMGMAHKKLGRLDEAIASYRKAAELKPTMVEAFNNLGNAYGDKGMPDEAIATYQKALEINPKQAEVYNNMGAAWKEKGDLDQAIVSYQRAIEFRPDFAEAHSNLGSAYRSKGDLESVVPCYRKAVELNPDLREVYNDLFFILRQHCEWEEARKISDKLDHLSGECLARQAKPPESPFASLIRHADPRRNQAIAQAWSRNIAQSVTAMRGAFSFEHRRVQKKKIVLGYISNDFRNHAVSHLILGLFGLHDRSAFEVYCYSYGDNDGSRYRDKISHDCDRFTDLRELSYAASAKRIYEDGVDILIDLMGYTKGHRLQISALRPAPVHISFLGFPGTTGADFFDYIITDRIITPEAHVPFYSEKCVFMPHCYQVNDSKQPISGRSWKRAQLKLPEEGFVFCSFNQSYKVEPVMFDVWMNILRQVPKSVLWLLVRSKTAETNLKNAARERGVDPGRLIFAERMIKEEHLARHKLADLALDTRIVNGHTTTSDALWAGVPVITLEGGHFASRVAASILNAVGMPELVAHSLEEYERLAVRLAGNADELNRLKERLIQNRLTQPLFNTARYARSLEGAYKAMWNIFVAGKQPRNIVLSEQTSASPAPLPPAGIQPSAKLASPVRQIDLTPLINKANRHYQAGRLNEAIAVYRKIAELKPDAIVAYGNMGNAFQAMGKLKEAGECYQKVLEVKPDSAEAYNNLGNVYEGQKQMDKAIACYQKAVELKPEFAQAYNNLGVVYRGQNKMAQAISCYQKAIELNPDLDKTYNSLIYLYQQFCEWEKVRTMSGDLDRLTRKSLDAGGKPGESPFTNLTRHPDPALNFEVARAWSTDMGRAMSNLKVSFSFEHWRVRKEKVVVGYVSNDFRNHAVAHLILGLFGLHDRSKLKIFAYSHGANDKSRYRDKVEHDCDKFTDIRNLEHADAARRIYEDGVDILVDLMGYTKDNRLEIFALRPAPVQVSFLGFPGTTGADFFDYIITDKIISPEAHEAYYGEKCVYMPHCYQVNDRNQAIADKKWTRTDLGLPENGIVFCSFNQAYKIDPKQFDAWMRILKQVPGSVLWLLLRSKAAEKTLRREAEARGVDPGRLVVADVMPKDEHLARHQMADLALDTRIVNGHTTTSDALWAGVPVVTQLGTHFASRVSASLLTAVGLPELITHSLAEYEALTVRLARHPEALQAIRQKLARNRLTYPMFDTTRYARNLEKAYAAMWDIFLSGEAVRPIEVADNEPLAGEPFISETQRPETSVIAPAFDVRNALQRAFQYHQAGDLAQARPLYEKILAVQPGHSDALHLSGVIAHQTGDNERAIVLIGRALQQIPDNPIFISNLGAAHQSLGNFDEALSCYEKALQYKPDYVEAYVNSGLVYKALGRYDKSVALIRKAVELKPDYAEAHNSLGLVFKKQGKNDQAVACFQKALQHSPDNVDALYHMGNMLAKQEEAIACFRKALALKPDHSKAYANLVHRLHHVCSWQEIGRMAPGLDAIIQKEVDKGIKTGEQPLMNLSRHMDPARNLAVAKSWSNHVKKSVAHQKTDFSFEHMKSAGGKIVVGYLSNDFRNHPVGHLVRGLFGLHNRNAFQVNCYSYSPDDGSHYRQRIRQDCDRFSDIRHLGYADAARRIHEDGVHILVDLMGHTGGENRMEICALRPAPVQATWLGFPGSTGADFFEYIITDRIVTPEEHLPCYSEQPIYMPHCYQVNDWTQPVSSKQYHRAECGLPANGVVFCSFNQVYKIDPALFDVWMNILRRVPDSVLWLLAGDDAPRRNLRQEVGVRGVDPGRLIFADRLPKDEHLARQKLADLALDTRVVNGHTTTSDILWSGVPVITIEGTHFASRVASSILWSVGLPELVTRSLREYEDLAVQLATDPGALQALRQKLDRNRLTEPLFDTPRFVRNLEKAYKEMWHAWKNGGQPQRIDVVESSGVDFAKGFSYN